MAKEIPQLDLPQLEPFFRNAAKTHGRRVMTTEAGLSIATPEIWRNEAEFGRMMSDLQSKTAALATAAKGGNVDAAKAALGAAGQTCKACHDKYKLD
jgi:cytochrome c556